MLNIYDLKDGYVNLSFVLFYKREFKEKIKSKYIYINKLLK